MKQNGAPITSTSWIDDNFSIPFGTCTAYYRVKALDITDRLSNYSNTVSTTGMPGVPKALTDANESQAPRQFNLQGNSPNPFNPVTTIRYALPVASRVQLTIYDVMGRDVFSHSAMEEAGYWQLQWQGKDHSGQAVPSGVYIYRLLATPTPPSAGPSAGVASNAGGRFVATRKMLLLK